MRTLVREDDLCADAHFAPAVPAREAEPEPTAACQLLLPARPYLESLVARRRAAPAELGELTDEVLGQPRAHLVAKRDVVLREAEPAELVAQCFAWMARATPAHRSAAAGDDAHDCWPRYERMRSATPS